MAFEAEMLAAREVETVATAGTLWLSVAWANSRRLFELLPDDPRAIVIGSMGAAEIVVEGHAIPEIACHLERDLDSIWLVPAYSRDLKVDGVPVTCICVLPWIARIDVGGVRLIVSVTTT
jgi:hypothetical protein